MSKVNYIKGYVYNASGEEIKKLKKSDIEDFSAVSQGSFYADDRVKYADLSVNQYPYTVEFEYEVSIDGLLFYPTWQPQNEEFIAVQKARFEIVTDGTILPRYLEQNIQPVSIINKDGKKVYQWKIHDLPSYDREPYGPLLNESVPTVWTAPGEFEMDGYQGNMSTWKGLGLWQNKLLSGRDDLSEEAKHRIKELVADKPDDTEKVKTIYDYLQSKTRYVSIQLGIGGWQPFASSFVDENGYGDCKALSFYTKSMLDAVGVKSYYTLVKAGRNENIIKDFPSRQFNHVILCVPQESDTIWLECTSQQNPFGYTGSFTGDRDVLLITEEGGKIAHTPVYTQQDNQQVRSADIYLDKNGDASAMITTLFKGLEYENDDLRFYLSESHTEQLKWLYNKIDISTFKINGFEFQQVKASIPEVTEKLDLNLPKFASVSGKRIFLSPNLMNKRHSVSQKLRNRKTEVIIRKAWVHSDTIRYHIPEGYHPEYVPEEINFHSMFGDYQAKVTVEEGVLTYIRTMKMNKGRNPAESYEELVKFLTNIMTADKSKIVLVSST